MVDLLRASFRRPRRSTTLENDDTADRVFRSRHLALFHTHYDTHCFLPIHIYEATVASRSRSSCAQAECPTGSSSWF